MAELSKNVLRKTVCAFSDVSLSAIAQCKDISLLGSFMSFCFLFLQTIGGSFKSLKMYKGSLLL